MKDIEIGATVTHPDYPDTYGTVVRHDIDGTTLVRWNDGEEGWEKTSELEVVHRAFDQEPRGDITDTITDADVVYALAMMTDHVNLKDYQGEGHPVNVVLLCLETDSRFRIDDDHARPELYEWAEENSFHLEEQAWMAWGFDEGCGCSESDFQERYHTRKHTRVEKFSTKYPHV